METPCFDKWLEKNGLDRKPHQVEGVRFCVGNEKQGRGGLIADEMGLGKTYVMLGTMLKTHWRKHSLFFHWLFWDNGIKLLKKSVLILMCFLFIKISPINLFLLQMKPPSNLNWKTQKKRGARLIFVMSNTKMLNPMVMLLSLVWLRPIIATIWRQGI